MSLVRRLYRWIVVDVGIVDALTAIVYALVLLAVLTVLGLWWVCPALIGILVVGGILRGWAKRGLAKRRAVARQ